MWMTSRRTPIPAAVAPGSGLVMGRGKRAGWERARGGGAGAATVGGRRSAEGGVLLAAAAKPAGAERAVP